MNDIATKRCSACKRTLSVDAFRRLTKAPDGRQYTCRECQAARIERWRQANRDRVKEIRRLWDQANPSKRKQYRHNSYTANAEARREYARRYRAENSEAVSEYNKAYAERDPERTRERKARYAADVRAQVLAH